MYVVKHTTSATATNTTDLYNCTGDEGGSFRFTFETVSFLGVGGVGGIVCSGCYVP